MSLYEILKSCGQIIFPAILTFVGLIGTELGWANTEIIMKIGTGFITMWNGIIVIWNKEYYKQQVEATNQGEI